MLPTAASHRVAFVVQNQINVQQRTPKHRSSQLRTLSFTTSKYAKDVLLLNVPGGVGHFVFGASKSTCSVDGMNIEPLSEHNVYHPTGLVSSQEEHLALPGIHCFSQ